MLVEVDKISIIGLHLTMPADRTIDARGQYVLPGGIDMHTHMDMPFGGTTSADDFESGTIAAAFGSTTTIVDFAIQDRGQTLHHAWETWMKKADGKAAIDYGFHMIITELTDQFELEVDAMVRQGVTSFKLFMAYPGVFMLDDGSIFRAMRRTGKNGGTICMHAENGGVIDVLVKEALAKGQTAPKYHALTRPARAEGEATHRAIALAEMAGNPDLAKQAVMFVNIEHVAQRNFSPGRTTAADGYREAVADSGEAPIAAGVTNNSPCRQELIDAGPSRFGVNFISERSTFQSGETGGWAGRHVAKVSVVQAPPLHHTTGEVLDVSSAPGLERMAGFLASFVSAVDTAPRERINP